MSNPVPPRQTPDQPWRSEGAPPPPPEKKKMPGGWGRLALTALLVFLLANLVLGLFNEGDEPTIAYTDALRLLKENRPRLDALSQALLENETLGEADAYRAAGITRLAKPDA